MRRWLAALYLGCLWLLVVPATGALMAVTASDWHDLLVRVTLTVLLDTAALTLLGCGALYLARRP